MENLTITYADIQSLKVADYNPRKWNEEQKKSLKESIEKFGAVDPLLVNTYIGRENIVIGGHFRLTVAKELGHKKVPVIYLSLPLDKEKELNIRLNKNQGEFDLELLKNFDTEILAGIGFSSNELLDIWSDLGSDDTEEIFDETEELQKIQEPKTRRGDIIMLGKHKLLCGDSSDASELKRLFDGKEASMIYSDPIYNLQINYNKGIGGKQNYGGEVNDNRTEEEYLAFLRKNIQSALTIAKNDCHIFYWNTEQQIWMLQMLYREFGIDNKRVCLWIKNGHNPTPKVAFNKCYEPCIYGTLGSPYLSTKEYNLTEVFNKDSGTGNESVDTITIWAEKRLSSKEYTHATSKPPELHHKAIRRCTRLDDIIFDSFGGSGSTLIACEQLKRRAYLVELEPLYCDLIIARYKKFVKDAVVTVIRKDEEEKV